MQKINQIVIVITLLMFAGQSYAALLMACDFSANPVDKSGDLQNTYTFDDNNSHQHHSVTHHELNNNVSMEEISFQATCDSEHHKCQCSLGSCSVVFLPVTAYAHWQDQVTRVSVLQQFYSDYQPSLLNRPPISV